MAPLLRPSTALRAARQVQTLRNPSSAAAATTTTTATTTSAAAAQGRLLSSSTPRRAAHGNESRYDEPTGWLWGVRPGEKYQNEGWERPFFWGYCGSLILFAIVYQFKPDTSYVAPLFLLPALVFGGLGLGSGDRAMLCILRDFDLVLSHR